MYKRCIMKRILVPCDFSKPAINAYRFALDVAALSNGTIHLINVIELPRVPNTILTPVRSLGINLMKEMSAKAQAKFEKISTNYKQQGVKIVCKVDFGVSSEIILTYAKKHSIDLIIMGSHGATGLKEFFVGSNAEKIIRASPIPVIVVKNFYKGHLKNIVFPNALDTENQKDLISKVKVLQTFFKAHLHLVWINTPVNFTTDTETIKRLTAFAKQFALKDFTINIYNHLDEEEGIIQFANSINADLIAMGTHGRKGLSHMMSGSMTENVANHGKSLIWTYVMKKDKKQ